jgi:uncharacterized protein
MRCPRCRSELRQLTWEADIAVDQCVSCRGIWLDKGELERIQETIERDYSEALGRISVIAQAYELARQKAAVGIRCPRCDRELYQKEYGYCSQILIDLCPDCAGIWLDRGELEALEMFFERERPDVREQAAGQGVRRGFWASLASLFGANK